MSRTPFGVVIAGGASTRYGEPKALVEVGGARIADRVAAVLRAVLADVVAIVNDRTLAAEIGLTWRADLRPGLGALGGIHAALHWAAEDGRPGILAVACDMPFVPSALLALLLEEAGGGFDVVIPESGGRRGIEPLCAYYATTCLNAIERAIDTGDHRMIGFHDAVNVRKLARSEVERHGVPDVVFLNVNTPEQRLRAERIAEGAGA
ncbi:MAG: molybdenum cofactor guanylyltransferase [Longimicrobiales bacterium]